MTNCSALDRDELYTRALNARWTGDLPKVSEVDEICGRRVATGQMLESLRRRGRTKSGMSARLVAALRRHGLELRDHPDNPERWQLRPAGLRVRWFDEAYAQALNLRRAGDLPAVTESDYVPALNADVPTGRMLEDLRTVGRPRDGMSDVLLAALRRHGLTPNGRPL
jgi:hypothetical protein